MVPKKGTAKKKDNTKPVGLTPAHYGFRVGENYFPPSEFAIGWIAATSPGDLEKILDSEVDKILQGKYKRGDILWNSKNHRQRTSHASKFRQCGCNNLKKRNSVDESRYKTEEICKKTCIFCNIIQSIHI